MCQDTGDLGRLSSMTETQEQWQCLPLTGKRKNHPWKGNLGQESLRSQSPGRTVPLTPQAQGRRGGCGALTLGLDFLLCKMGLLKPPLGYRDGQTLWLPPTCSVVMVARAQSAVIIVCLSQGALASSHPLSCLPFPATGLDSVLGWHSEGGRTPVPAWTRAPECGNTFLFRPQSC